MSAVPEGLPSWLGKNRGAKPAIVISTRIRLARNLEGLNFPAAADAESKQKVLLRVQEALAAPEFKGFSFRRLYELSGLERGRLAERGLCHAESAKSPEGIGLAMDKLGERSILLNEEDHLRLQVILPGFKLEEGMAGARHLDEALAAKLPFTTDPQLGYLTACPTNVGTGLRASVMLHLPALAMTQGLLQVLKALIHMGLAVRGLSGEGTQIRSVFFQVSNQVTLGRSENEIIAHLAGVTRQIVERESDARNKLRQDSPDLLQDKIGRALGFLSGCGRLTLEESLDMLSAVRLGVETGRLPVGRLRVLNELLLAVQPAHLQSLLGKELDEDAQAAARALLVRKRLGLSEPLPVKNIVGRKRNHVR